MLLPNINHSVKKSLGRSGYYSQDTGLGLLKVLEFNGDLGLANFNNLDEQIYKSYLKYNLLIFKLREGDANLENNKNIIFKLRRLNPDIKIFNYIELSDKEETKSLIDFSRECFFTNVYINNLFDDADIKELVLYSHKKDLDVGINYNANVLLYDFLEGRDFMFFRDSFYYFDVSQKGSSTEDLKEVFDFLLSAEVDNRLNFNTVGLNTIDYNDSNHSLYANNAYLAASIIGFDGCGISNKDSGETDVNLVNYYQPYFPKAQRYRYMNIPSVSTYSGTEDAEYNIVLDDMEMSLIWLNDVGDVNALGATSERKILIDGSEIVDSDIIQEDHDHANATSLADGFMSSDDKSKLDEINISSGSADPTGGSSGDIYLQHE